MVGNQTLIKEYETIHASTSWGGTSVKNLRFIKPLVDICNPKSIIDYGCGKSPLLDNLSLDASVEKVRYDPAIPEYSKVENKKNDLLVNFDVLEHIEEEDIDDVLRHMASLSKKAIVVIDIKPAELTLSDGRNAHVTLKPREWWEAKLTPHFGKLYPVKTKRSGRIGFRNFSLSLAEKITFYALRIKETLKYYLFKLKQKL
ncbi:MAG: hypothetical protein CMH30_09365 [Micavibrio sp.]|nr:hypothetical protein [Micavibrio sp.]|tara:strand:+ start:4488 stop:5090 length:603 start_codon:yes stop_codon:yes gene_type:complete